MNMLPCHLSELFSRNNALLCFLMLEVFPILMKMYQLKTPFTARAMTDCDESRDKSTVAFHLVSVNRFNRNKNQWKLGRLLKKLIFKNANFILRASGQYFYINYLPQTGG